jgi:hypothetical protein
VAFSRKQRKRLKDKAILIKNAKKMAVEMEEINSKYAIELRLVIERIKSITTKSETIESSLRILQKRKIRSFRSLLGRKNSVSIYERKKAQNKNYKKEPDISPELETNIENKDIPLWAKDVWRKLMLHCHPDRINLEELPPEESKFRNYILMSAMTAHGLEDWPELLLLGILVDQYTEKLSHKKQTVHLDNLYAVTAEEINKIQNSNYWHWGNNWDSLETRLKILLGLLQANNIQALPVTDLTKIILDLEDE